jgi:hypothetical protein
MTKAEAIDKVLRILGNRMAMMSKPMTDEASFLSTKYCITAIDLLERQREIVMNI